VQGGEVLTTPLGEHILASITRRFVIEECDAQERSCTLEELLTADEAFLASTARETQPVAEIDGQRFEAPGPVTARVAEAVEARIRAELAAQA
jgi:branched-chain amino acid aminotransferase